MLSAPTPTLQAPVPQTGTYLYLPHTRLRLHPKNIRQFIPPEDAQKMAESIRAGGGVLQALLVVTDPERAGSYLVVDGNLRLAGGRVLGRDCPALKCEVISAGEAEQLLIMATTSHHHYPKRPVDEALHYARLRDEEGYSVRQIARLTGINEANLHSRLKLLELEPEVQELVNQGKLTKDVRVTTALLNIPDKQARIQLAQTIAAKKKRITINAILATANQVAKDLGNGHQPAASQKPTSVPTKFLADFAAKTVVELRKDADLLEEALVVLDGVDDDLCDQLKTRVWQLRHCIQTATGGRHA